jgi:hypothetical protein
VFPLRYYALRFLGAAPEVIIQARSLMNQGVPVSWESLNRHRIFDVWSQALIELGHFGALVLIDPREVLREPYQVLRNRCVLFQLYKLELRDPNLVQIPIKLC